MYRHIVSEHKPDKDYPQRTARLQVLQAVLDGTFYDVLPYHFHEEYLKTGEYCAITKRAPSVRTNLCAITVEDSVAMLFSEGRFPIFECENKPTAEALMRLSKEAGLNATMIAAAQRGSVGSVLVWLRVLEDKVYFEYRDTTFLTPEWNPVAPDTLLRVTERVKVPGAELAARGYDIPPDQIGADWWFQRVWDDQAETWFLPQSLEDASADPPKPMVVDPAKTVQHKLGFVPMVWVKNLPGGDDIDGRSTFGRAIETVVDLDYLLSAGNRALLYQAAPRLVIKGYVDPGTLGPGDILQLEPDGEAKVLEISGNSSEAIKEYAEILRERALEAMHGNRTSQDRLSAASSGRAMELMHQSLIQLADQLRASYGEAALVQLLQMVVRASQALKLKFRNGEPVPKMPANALVTLKWGPWFALTPRDKVEQATALKTNRDATNMSRETAVKALARTEDIEDVQAEIGRIQTDIAEQDARDAALKAQVKDQTTAAA